MRKFVIHGNCQCAALAKTLLENPEFSSVYEWDVIKPIQNLNKNDISEVVSKVSNADLFIFQPIKSTVTRPIELGSDYLLNLVKNSATCISFPSLYFDGYFPHLAPMNGLTSILAQAHDYVIAYCSAIKMSKNKIYELIESKDLYSYDLSMNLIEDSFNALEVREQEDRIDIKISNFLRKNYLKHKLFNQFRHPRRPVFIYLANMILSNIDISPYKFESHIEYLDSVVAPIYKSTYLNLSLGFEENFEYYKTIKGKFVHQTDVIDELLKFYGQLEIDFLRRIIEQKKPFVPRIVEAWLTK